MGRALVALVLALVLALPARADQGEIEIWVDGQYRCRTRVLNLSSQLFNGAVGTLCPGPTANLTPGGQVNLGGACVGDDPGGPFDLCPTVDGTQVSITWGIVQALTAIFSTSVTTPLIYGGTGASDTLTLDATSGASSLDNTTAAVRVLNALNILPVAWTSNRTGATEGLNIGTVGQSNTLSGSGGNYAAINRRGTFNYTAAPNGVVSWYGDFVIPVWSGNAGAGTYGGLRGYFWQPTVGFTTSSGAHTLVGLHALQSGPILSAMTGSATGALARSASVLESGATIGAGWTLTDMPTIYKGNPTNSGTITRLGLAEVEDLTAGATNYLIWSKGAGPFLAMGGSAIFGASQSSLTAPATSAGVEIGGTTKALLLSRLNTSQVNALTAANGYTVYDSDKKKLVVREDDVWAPVPAIVAEVNLTGQTASIGSTTLYTPSQNSRFRITVEGIVTTAATTGAVTSQVGGIAITYTDVDTNASANITVATSNTGNVVGTSRSQGSTLIYAKSGVAIQYNVGYASNTAAQMQYALRIRLEHLN